MDTARIDRYVSHKWDEDIVPRLVEYIRIPNKSPLFDPDWVAHGYMDQAVELMAGWARAQPISGMQVEVVRLEGRTPLIFIDIPGTDPASDDCVLLYGHLDKQPEMTGWAEDLGPWKPVLKGDKLYGRGGADDGYAIFGSLAAILALQEQGVPHARCVVLIEACEESGSYDLPFYVDHLAARIGKPSLVVCLATWFVIERTQLGSYLRAANENPNLVRTFGINVPRMLMLTYGLGVGLAGFSGVMAAPIYQVNPLMGSNLIIVVFAVVVIGGMGSIVGSIVAGFALGILEGLAKVFYPEIAGMVVFIAMLLTLIVRPNGLFGNH